MTTTKPAAESGPTIIVPPHAASPWVRTLRETVESVVIAFILAFLFRTFEAEAFVIPTGSMAPTLQGRHKDIECPQCGYQYQTSASSEVDKQSSARIATCNVTSATCPMCRYTVQITPGKSEYPSYNGDRIIVNKFVYSLSDPQRWDVVVFKYPEDAKTNYIKRLVGLPDERVRIAHGDIYTAPLATAEFQIARKPPAKLQHMLQPVYDNDYVVPALIDAGMPPRWQPWTAPGQQSPWSASADYKSFQSDGSSPDRAWMRYQHLLPTPKDWQEVVGHHRIAAPPRPSLITDDYAYNDGDTTGCREMPQQDSPQFVGDLALDFQLEVKNDRGSVIFELVKGGRQFRCQIDLASGEARLSISGLPAFQPIAQTSVRGPGSYELSFANVDQQLLLWIDGRLVEFNEPTAYPDLNNFRPVQAPPLPGSEQPTDLSPVGIAVQDGAAVTVSQMRIRRDIFYLSPPRNPPNDAYDLNADQFLMLGDNSPQSSDSRYWTSQNYVDRKLLIGKALFIYWPHSFNYVEIGSTKIPIPFWPNFGAMKFVH